MLFTPAADVVVDIVSKLPWELSIVLAIVRSVVEVATLVGSATLVVQAVTLGASLLPAHGSAGGWGMLFPSGRWECRTLVATSAVRLLMLPLCALGLVHWLGSVQLLPNCSACKMALLVQSCMPSAQNLVTLVNLQPGTKAMAAPLAQLLLRQYLIAVVPCTVWVSIFMLYLRIPVTLS
jgi:predicted permease